MSAAGGAAPRPAAASPNWTVWLGTRVQRTVPRGQWLPDRQPAYVASWIYVFGVLTLSSFLVVLASGGWLVLGGVTWWHTSSVGHFVNSLWLNAVGIGAWFNVLNPGQMLLWHVVLLPFVLGVLIVAHVILVRRHGVVPPIDADVPAGGTE